MGGWVERARGGMAEDWGGGGWVKEFACTRTHACMCACIASVYTQPPRGPALVHGGLQTAQAAEKSSGGVLLASESSEKPTFGTVSNGRGGWPGCMRMQCADQIYTKISWTTSVRKRRRSRPTFGPGGGYRAGSCQAVREGRSPCRCRVERRIGWLCVQAGGCLVGGRWDDGYVWAGGWLCAWLAGAGGWGWSWAGAHQTSGIALRGAR